ncbi:MAG: MAPEG family protein [Hyphomicrobiales bacterium]|nr:MAPEG family protein [Hyphomicrobiales bacterium]
MNAYFPVAIITILSGLLCFAMAIAVARAHLRTGILAPAMTGDPRLERTARAHANTLEWMPIFLPALWLFAIYWSVTWATALGALWIIGRIVYFMGYVSAANKRAPGFFIQTLAAVALLLGALGRIVYLMLTTGA